MTRDGRSQMTEEALLASRVMTRLASSSHGQGGDD
jgi:hypothetical protein